MRSNLPPAGAVDLDRALSALSAIPPDLPRSDWLRAVTASISAGIPAESIHSWSADAATYKRGDLDSVLRGLSPDGGIGPGTLFHLAKAHGWRDDAPPRRPSPEDLARQQAERQARAAAEAAAKKRRNDAVAAEAVQRLAAADPAEPVHPYLQRKAVAPGPDMRQEGAALLVPVTTPAGTVRGLQVITGDGEKRFARGTSMAGCLWWARPPAELAAGGRIVIVEGVADALTVAAAVTDAAVACAFSASNMPKVAASLRELYSVAEIIIAADADEAGRLAAAKATAADPRIRVRLPEFGLAATLDGPPAKDWNELARLEGLDVVRRQFLDLTDAPPPAPADDDPAGADAASGFSLPQVCPYGAGSFVVRADGVHFADVDKKGDELPERWLCGALRIVAKTRDPAGIEWGRLLEWVDEDGKPHRWAAPLELLQGDGGDVRRELARRGLAIAPGRTARELLAAFIQVWPVDVRARCVDRLGWIGGAYVLPDAVIGTADGGEAVVFQGKAAAEAAHATAGTVDDWRQTVAALAAGNTRLVFAIATAFAGPLMYLLDAENGGFHLRGRSSSGKSTALFVGASVWGGPGFVRPWRATASGLEGVAVLHTDGTLFLDELAECDPRQVGETVYMLANGRGKARSSATGAARPTARWRVLFLSSGELSLEAQIATVGRRSAAGLDVRLADIEADAGAGMGVFEALNGHGSPQGLALALKDAAARYYGAVGVAWLRVLVAHRAAIAEAGRVAVDRFAADVVPAGASGQVGRVARRFGLVAAAGELATRARLTGWQQGEATRAAQSCFTAWLAGFGGAGDREERAILEQVRGFFEVHGASRFEDISLEHGQRVPNRAGFYRHAGGSRVFMALPGVFRNEICAGLDQRTVVRVLRARGWIDPEDDRHAAQLLRPPGVGPTRLYVFTDKIWGSDDE